MCVEFLSSRQFSRHSRVPFSGARRVVREKETGRSLMLSFAASTFNDILNMLLKK